MLDILEYIPIINFIWQIIYSITVYLKLIYKLQLLLPFPTESIKILQRGGGGWCPCCSHWFRACTRSTKLYHTTGFTRDLIVPLVLPNYWVCRRRRLYVYYNTWDGVRYYRPLVTSVEKGFILQLATVRIRIGFAVLWSTFIYRPKNTQNSLFILNLRVSIEIF